MKKEHNFFVDAETDGLSGDFLSVAVLVTDAFGVEIDRFYAAIRIEYQDVKKEWVRKNVFPFLQNAELFFDNTEAMLEAFWKFWLLHRETSNCIAYVQYPVEARLFAACVAKDVAKREQLAPYPIYDLSTLLMARGYSFDAELQELSGTKLISHDAMNDVYMTAKVWHKLMEQTAKE